MIDYIKAHFKEKQIIENNLLEQNSLYKVTATHNFQNNENEYPLRAKIENLCVNITDKGGYVQNSLHKHFNALSGNETQNYDDFHYCELIDSLGVLEAELNYPLKDMILTNLEFGFNIDLGFNPTLFLERNLLMYKLKTPCMNPKNKRKMKIKKFIYNNYEFKIYDKSLHFDLKNSNPNILRIEVKYKSKKELNKFGIFNLADLEKPECLKALFKDFLKKYDDLLIVDSYKGNLNMKPKERQFFTDCTNYQHWIELREKHHRNTIYKKIDKLKKLIKKYDLDLWKRDLKDLIELKFKQLIKSDCFDNFNDYKYVA